MNSSKMTHSRHARDARAAAEPYRARHESPLCIIYCRVSTFGQAGDNSTSLESQEYNAKALASERGYRIKQICKEVKSAYNSTMSTLNDIFRTNRNIIVVMNDVSRFCRNIVDGLKMAEVALAKNNTLVFVADSLTISNQNRAEVMDQFTRLLKAAEVESARLGERVKAAQKYLKDTGKYAGGSLPYGMEIRRSSNPYVNNTLRENKPERDIIEFIAVCKKNTIASNDLNAHMKKISPLVPYVEINCYDKDQVTPLKTINTALTNAEIADLLNDYHVKKRGRPWTAAMVKSINTTPTIVARYEIDAMADIDSLSLGAEQSMSLSLGAEPLTHLPAPPASAGNLRM
jgi:DNA invertase Pin-like site-specific DNA recombinase